MSVTYDGSAFFGFQYQPEVSTVQGELERVIKSITKKKCRVIGAGRTDAGVHAVEQVVLLRIECPIPIEKLIIGMNGALPGFLRVSRAEEVNSSFHPRFSAKAKHYRYLFHHGEKKSPFLERFFWQIEQIDDFKLIKKASEMFVGEHDFYSFAKSPQKYESTIRKIISVDLTQNEQIIQFDVIGTGFMHNMVRNLAKALYLVGMRKMTPKNISELYRNHNRNVLGAPAPPGGLYLMKVMY
jgi:tRNA pseudouridine38-40 synthase